MNYGRFGTLYFQVLLFPFTGFAVNGVWPTRRDWAARYAHNAGRTVATMLPWDGKDAVYISWSVSFALIVLLSAKVVFFRGRTGRISKKISLVSQTLLFEFGYIPLLSRQFAVLGCSEDPGDGRWTLASDATQACFGSTEHLVISCLAIAAVLLLCPLSMAFMFAEGQDIADPIRYLKETNLVNQFLFTGVAGSIYLIGNNGPGFVIAYVALAYTGMAVANYWYAPALGRGHFANNLKTVALAAGAWTGMCGCVSYATMPTGPPATAGGTDGTDGDGGGVTPVMWTCALGFVPVLAAAYCLNSRRARKLAIPGKPLHYLLSDENVYVRYAAAAAYEVMAHVRTLSSTFWSQKAAAAAVEGLSKLQRGALRPGEAAFVKIQCSVSVIAYAKFERRLLRSHAMLAGQKMTTWGLTTLMDHVLAHWNEQRVYPPDEYFWMVVCHPSFAAQVKAEPRGSRGYLAGAIEAINTVAGAAGQRRSRQQRRRSSLPFFGGKSFRYKAKDKDGHGDKNKKPRKSRKGTLRGGKVFPLRRQRSAGQRARNRMTIDGRAVMEPITAGHPAMLSAAIVVTPEMDCLNNLDERRCLIAALLSPNLADAADVIAGVLEQGQDVALYRTLARHLVLKLGAYVQHLAVEFHVASPAKFSALLFGDDPKAFRREKGRFRARGRSSGRNSTIIVGRNDLNKGGQRGRKKSGFIAFRQKADHLNLLQRNLEMKRKELEERKKKKKQSMKKKLTLRSSLLPSALFNPLSRIIRRASGAVHHGARRASRGGILAARRITRLSFNAEEVRRRHRKSAEKETALIAELRRRAAKLVERGIRCMEALLRLHDLSGLLSVETARAVALLTLSFDLSLQHAGLAFVREVTERGGFLAAVATHACTTAQRVGFSPQLVVGMRLAKAACDRVQALGEEIQCIQADADDGDGGHLIGTEQRLTTLWVAVSDSVREYCDIPTNIRSEALAIYKSSGKFERTWMSSMKSLGTDLSFKLGRRGKKFKNNLAHLFPGASFKHSNNSRYGRKNGNPDLTRAAQAARRVTTLEFYPRLAVRLKVLGLFDELIGMRNTANTQSSARTTRSTLHSRPSRVSSRVPSSNH